MQLNLMTVGHAVSESTNASLFKKILVNMKQFGEDYYYDFQHLDTLYTAMFL